MAQPHVVSVLLRDAARGRFPPPDGTVRVVGSAPGGADAVVAFTAHNVIAAGIDQGEVLQHLPSQDPGAPMSAEFLTWLAIAPVPHRSPVLQRPRGQSPHRWKRTG